MMIVQLCCSDRCLGSSWVHEFVPEFHDLGSSFGPWIRKKWVTVDVGKSLREGKWLENGGGYQTKRMC